MNSRPFTLIRRTLQTLAACFLFFVFLPYPLEMFIDFAPKSPSTFFFNLMPYFAWIDIVQGRQPMLTGPMYIWGRHPQAFAILYPLVCLLLGCLVSWLWEVAVMPRLFSRRTAE